MNCHFDIVWFICKIYIETQNKISKNLFAIKFVNFRYLSIFKQKLRIVSDSKQIFFKDFKKFVLENFSVFCSGRSGNFRSIWPPY